MRLSRRSVSAGNDAVLSPALAPSAWQPDAGKSHGSKQAYRCGDERLPHRSGEKTGSGRPVVKPGPDALDQISQPPAAKVRREPTMLPQVIREDSWPSVLPESKIALVGRGRHLHLQSEPGYHSWPEDHLRFLGNISSGEWKSSWSVSFAGTFIRKTHHP